MDEDKAEPVSAGISLLTGFAPAARNWFASAFGKPTPVQSSAWSAIRSGASTLVIAPTGSGKTLAAFMHSIDRLYAENAFSPAAGPKKRAAVTGTKVLYISPLKALGADIQKNLDVPLRGIAAERERLGEAAVEISVGMRTGDTPSAERAALVRRPPDILITTPESLYLMLTSKARETLRGVDTVIIDEIHAVAGTKRGAHLALSLERLDMLLPAPAQRVGLSATVRPIERVAEFLGGALPVTVVNPASDRRLDMRIVVPVEDMTDLPVPAAGPAERLGRAGSIWFHVESSIMEMILARRSTIVFVNSRGLAERLTARLNELYAERLGGPAAEKEVMHYESATGGTGNRASGEPGLLARSHHGSVSKERRTQIEQELKSGELRCVVATSSLELGIDMGQVEQVIQVAAPPSVSSGLQRVGRSGHHVGGTPSGLIYPRTRRDLVDAAVTVERMRGGLLEGVTPLSNPLDILAQQTVAAVAMEPLDAEKWYAAVRRSDPFRTLPRSAFDATLDMLAGRFPSDEFAGFRPRLVWNRTSGTLTARPGAQRLAVINGGTIPDRGTFRVVLPENEEQSGARRVGELDEEMVYESRVNDVITLGASSWRITQITSDQVVVTPAPGKSARLPFWHGDGPGRTAELGEAIGVFLRELDAAAPGQMADERLQAAGMDGNASANLLNLLAEQRAATGALPTDRTLVIERCHDELGDWRLMLHSPYGRRVHAPWALAVAERINRRFNLDAAVIASDDGIVARIPDSEGVLPGAELFVFDPDDIQRLVTDAVGSSSLFAARFRECASRALLLPRRAPGRRSPLWQQRLRAGQLLEVARAYPDFPILLETARECLQDVYDLPALRALMRRVAAGTVRLEEAATESPSPFATNLLFGYVGEFMYKGDIPLAERRASLLSLDVGLLSDLLGQTDFGELLDKSVIERVSAELQRTAADRRASGLEGVADLLRELGPLSTGEVAARLTPAAAAGQGEAALSEAGEYLKALADAQRAIQVRIGGNERWAAVEDAARLRDALGVSLPDGIPPVFLEAVPDPLRDLVSRHARTHGPFTTGQAAARLGVGVAVADEALNRLREQGKLMRGEFGAAAGMDAGGTGDYPGQKTMPGSPLARHEWVWDEVFRRLRARSLQAAREATRPVSKPAYVRQLLERQYLVGVTPAGAAQGVARPERAALRGVDGVARVIEQLSGLPLPASLWESHIFPARVQDYAPGMLDELIATGEALWSGSGPIGEHDGLVALHLSEFAAETLPTPPGQVPGQLPEQFNELSDLQQSILSLLADGGAYFARQIAELARPLAAAMREAAHAAAPTAPPITMPELRDALWKLVWAGYLSSDTWSTIRAFLGARTPKPAHKTRTVRRRFAGGGYRSYSFTAKTGMPVATTGDDAALTGRWSLLPRADIPDTTRALAVAEGLLDRYGVVTRSAAVAEKIPGGFPALQRIFDSMEDAGRLLRGRFVDGLGASQYADHLTIDRLRELAETQGAGVPAVALSAADPANPYGTAMPWPGHDSKTKPTRHAGALVVISNGRLALWLSQGGRNLLTFPSGTAADADESLKHAAEALAEALKRSHAATFTIENVDDRPAGSSPMATLLRANGFSYTPQGLCCYGKVRKH